MALGQRLLPALPGSTKTEEGTERLHPGSKKREASRAPGRYLQGRLVQGRKAKH